MTAREFETVQKRLRILSEDEIEAIYERPRLTHEERIHYFSLSQPEKKLLVQLRSVKSQAYFVLQLGYFKAKHLFFIFDLHEVTEDLQYVLEQHFGNRKSIGGSLPARMSISSSKDAVGRPAGHSSIPVAVSQ